VAVAITDHAYKKRLQGSVLPASTEEMVNLLNEKIEEQEKRIKELENKVGGIIEEEKSRIGVISERDGVPNASPVNLQRSQEEIGTVSREQIRISEDIAEKSSHVDTVPIRSNSELESIDIKHSPIQNL
jgi:phosphopantetheine adenylyltransferase